MTATPPGSPPERSGEAQTGGAAIEAGIEARLASMRVVLPGPHLPHPPLLGAVVWDDRARTSGQLPRVDGRLTCVGRMGDTVSVEAGQAAARLCVLNALSVLRHTIGSLDRVRRVVTMLGFIASDPAFTQQPAVLDGASSALTDIFGSAGTHSRSAVGVSALPHGASVELELEVELHPGWATYSS